MRHATQSNHETISPRPQDVMRAHGETDAPPSRRAIAAPAIRGRRSAADATVTDVPHIDGRRLEAVGELRIVRLEERARLFDIGP